MRGTCRRKVSFVRVVRAFPIVNMVDQLGNQKIEVGVALAVAMARQIDRHAVHMHGEIGAVIQIEASEEVLICLAAAAVLRDDHSGDGLQHLCRPQQRPAFQLPLVYGALASGIRVAHETVVIGCHDDHRDALASGQAGGHQVERNCHRDKQTYCAVLRCS